MPNTNTLIENKPYETISNAVTVLEFLRDYHSEPTFTERCNSNIATVLILDWIKDALSFESGRVEELEIKLGVN
ncbi:hypothetical protein [Alteromonas sp. a30]|uniref:hypothetical protein n=1 Tax=Alteromonas sp. a30 TaxID=2730917 RepID=UPI0022821D62|nr:hypothetical protein [Alteromonas sp. a30]MCY7297511.1 hypothetical protein [Alteromonas sp. a30]